MSICSAPSDINFESIGSLNYNQPDNILNGPKSNSVSNNSLDNDQSKIASEIGTKKKKTPRIRFTPQEDTEIVRLVSIHGDNDWKRISDELSKQAINNIQRTPRQCKDRYVNYLCPGINKGEWTIEEDQIIMFNFMLTVPHFKIMKNLFPGRSEAAIKNRFKHLYKYGLGLLKPKIDSNISSNEDESVNMQNQKFNNGSLSKSACPISDQFLNNFNLNFGPIYSNFCKSAVTNIFNNAPEVLKSIQNNHLRINQRIFSSSSLRTALDNSFRQDKIKDGNMPIFQYQNASNDISQVESDSEFFDSLHWLELF